ncbi:sigma 54-interacting transcriptional regulator [Alkalihalophilus lindianensis]|uniref:HTH-type transcriptional regulatory protein TyrR n=1 Tax=Alkalihalophilus lindianensis TaxID=1630542 RepID=A0ABU3XEI6_9BACI|nr:sigma 54-interacting transcriptional regulator [Alkalihalophilus lindianensis]MDV2686310.1 sigma 54-interacting transcriptional regulator [Alkalihalophilus lindianensis]
MNFPNEHFSIMLNHLSDGVFIANNKGVTLWVNDTSTKQLGIDRVNLIGKTVDALEKVGVFTPSVTKIVLKSRKTTTKVQTSKGRQYLATGYLITTEMTEYVLVHVKDITETVKASFKLEKTEALMKQYWQEIQEMKLAQKNEKDNPHIIGVSKPHVKMIDLINRVANFDATILLNGETGVGKSFIAQELHKKSSRSDKSFVQINCSAIPETLLESELFGYMKGAFTGANSKGKEGLVERANGGTLFLDEIGELPLHLQPKLLQLLQEKSYIPIGATSVKKADVRIVTATNQNLPEMIKQKKFREDLYYRLNVISITIPPLKERKDDILPLLYHYLTIYKTKYDRDISFSKEVIELLQDYSWPGNIRELENTVERLVITTFNNVITLEDLPDKILSHSSNKKTYDFQEDNRSQLENMSLPQYIEKIEREIIEKALRDHKSTRKAAKSLGMTQSSITRRIKKYNLSTLDA